MRKAFGGSEPSLLDFPNVNSLMVNLALTGALEGDEFLTIGVKKTKWFLRVAYDDYLSKNYEKFEKLNFFNQKILDFQRQNERMDGRLNNKNCHSRIMR